MSEVQFWILLGNELAFVLAQLNYSLIKFFTYLRKNPDVTRSIPTTLSYKDCQFYRLKAAVSATNEDAAKQACSEKSNWVPINPRTTIIRQLADRFDDEEVYLVIDFPDPFGESNRAIGSLAQNHPTLFKCLQVTVETLGGWCQDDVERNLQGGILTNNDNHLPPEFRQIQEALTRKRVYEAADEQRRDCQNARAYQSDFDRIFTPDTSEVGSRSMSNDREFAAFYNVLRCYSEDAHMIKDETSSALKASNFTVHFVHPPFFSGNNHSRGFKYHQEKTWGFPLFVESISTRNAWRKFTPRSDWMVISSSHDIPFAISEVISLKKESDRSRMLVQAIAIARTGQFLLQSTSKHFFYVVAIYVNTNMVASRYIVMQTGRGNTEHVNKLYHNNAVCIHRTDFDLTDDKEEVNFLHEMYNLATQITLKSGELDHLKAGSLKDIKAAAGKVLSLSSKHAKTKTAGGSVMSTIPEGSKAPEASQGEDELGIFEAEDVRNVLDRMKYKIEFIPWGHPELAVIASHSGDKHGYLKFVEREREINVLRYLTEIESPSNHTVSGVRFWPVQGGTVISMPVAGGWLTSLDNPREQLRSAALQLFEAVAFMHEHNVAHMDLKPQNVIIPSEGGHLSIIDFSVSIRVRGPDVKYTGIVGTDDYMAPEVRRGEYKPMLADLWSCGRTIEELCSRSGFSSDRTVLLEIARRLMDRDPEARPRMSTVLEWMSPARRAKENIGSSALEILPTDSSKNIPLCA